MVLQKQLDGRALSPEPLLRAIDNYRGKIYDLDRSIVVQSSSLAAGTASIAKSLFQEGFSAGDRVLMALGNGPIFIAALSSILAGGGTPVLLHAETPPDGLRRLAYQYGAEQIVSDNWSPKEMESIASRVRQIEGDEAWLRLTISRVEPQTERSPVDFPRLPGVPLHPTSGTTGTPKLAARPGPCAVAEAEHYIEAMEIDADDLVLCVVPMSHAYGYGMGTMVPLVSGADLATMRRFHPKQLGKAIRDYPITTLPMAPAMLDLLMLADPESLCDGPRRVTSAGAPLPKRTADRVKKRTGTIVRPLYGTTETGGISVAVANEQLSGSCVGRPMNGVSARLEPVEGLELLEDHAERDESIGRLFIRSSSMMGGYVQSGGIDSSVLNDGWFETGDLAYLDESGAIHLVGREKEVINVFGMKVIPSEIEEVIASIPAVHDVKVYPGRHRSGSQIVKVAAAGEKTLAVETIREHCKKQLAPYKQPEVIHLLENLPRSPLGKILSDQLP